jgi:hypothetical protein
MQGPYAYADFTIARARHFDRRPMSSPGDRTSPQIAATARSIS